MSRHRQINSTSSDLKASILAKVATMVPAALLGLLTTRIVIDNYGTEGFAFYSLIISIPLILPFADFGLGGAVTELVSQRDVIGAHTVYSKIRSTVRILSSIGCIVIIVSWVLYFSGLWPILLGMQTDSASIAAAATASMFGIGIPITIGYRVLLGLQLNRVVVWLQGLTGALGAILVIPAVYMSAPLWIVATLPAIAAVILSSIGVTLARQHLKYTLPYSGRPSTDTQIRIARLAMPMAIIAIATPLSYQSDRIILSNFSSSLELAMYAAAFQIYAPMNAILVAGGQTLWPRLTKLRVTGAMESLNMVYKFSVIFGLAAASASIVLIAAGKTVTDWTTNGSAESTVWLLAGFGCMLIVNAIQYPFGMFMMSESGLMWQSVFVTAMTFLKIPLAIILAREFGAAGPVLASILSFTFLVLFPSLIWCRFKWKVGNDVRIKQ